MDSDPILKIVVEVAKQLSAAPWKLIAIQGVIMLLAAAVGAFLGEHLRMRGKSLATKADVASVLKQLSANTRLVEAIQTEVSQKDWSRREWANLRRAKLEELTRSLQSGRTIDWSLIAPMLRIPHEQGKYTVPGHDHGTHVAGILAGDWRKDESKGLL